MLAFRTVYFNDLFNNIFCFRSQSNFQTNLTDADQGEPENSSQCTAGDEQDTTETDDTTEEQLNGNELKRKGEMSRSRKLDTDEHKFSKSKSLVRPSIKKNKANDTLVQLLKNKEQDRQQLGKYVTEIMETSEENEVDLFFRSLAATVKKFEPEDVIEAKMKIFNVVTEIEIRNQRAKRSRMSTFNENSSRPSSAMSSHSSSHTYVEQSSTSNMYMVSPSPNTNFSENAPYVNPPLQFQVQHSSPMMSPETNIDLSNNVTYEDLSVPSSYQVTSNPNIPYK